MRSRLVVALSCGVALSALASPSFAQDAPAASAAKTDSASDAQNPDSDRVGDIIITANKRSERLQDVPVAVTVVGPDQLTQQNIVSAEDLTRAAPSLTAQNGARATLRIRGIGSLTFSRTSEGSVGIVVDGVPLANSTTGSPQLFDVARVEVLEGPQGTLFGRNSSAGIINITTNAPDPAKIGVVGDFQGGTRDGIIAQAALNLPVSDNAALRFTGSYTHQPQAIFNIPNSSWNNNKALNFRGRFKWTPNEAITINLIGDYSKVDRTGGAGFVIYKSTPGSPLTTLLQNCGITVNRLNNKACIDGPNDDHAKTYGFSGQVDIDLGGPTLTSISAYRALKSGGLGGDSDQVPIDILDINQSTYDIRNFSQEFRLTSPSTGFLQYVVGLYYFDSAQYFTGLQRGFVVPTLPFPLGQGFTTRASNTSYAAFGQATLNFTSKFRGIVGLRYGGEEVTANTVRFLAPGAGAPFASIAPVSGHTKDSYFSYRGGLQYDVNRDLMIYATYTKGYKGPALNDQAAPNVPFIVRPEIPHALEGGIKATLFDGRVGANLAVFRTVIIDFQSQFYDPATLAFIYGNAPKLTTKGVSLNVFGRPTKHLTINLGAIYNDAKYGKGYLVSCAQLQTAAQGCMPVLGAGGAVVGTVDDAGGNQLIGAPKWKLTGNVEYSVDVSPRLQGFVQADATYSSRVLNNQAYDPLNSIEPNTLVGARIGIRSPNQNWSLAFYVRNLLDERVPSFTTAAPLASSLGDPSAYIQLLQPDSFRTFGGALSFKF